MTAKAEKAVNRPLARLMLISRHHLSSKESGQIVDDVDMTYVSVLTHCCCIAQIVCLLYHHPNQTADNRHHQQFHT
jgi:hypothetical protein